jgi:enoyl-CoA hydratase
MPAQNLTQVVLSPAAVIAERIEQNRSEDRSQGAAPVGAIEKTLTTAPAAEPITYEIVGAVAVVTMNRPRYANAQNDHLTYALDAALTRAVQDDGVGAIVLRGEGEHFSGGHDLGTPDGRDWVRDVEQRSAWYSSEGKTGGERFYSREQEVYLAMCRQWRELPKPTIAAVQGACIAGGLMLAWVCDMIVASDDAFFTDPVVAMGVPGVEYFAHAFEMPNRIAREFLMLGEKMTAARAYELGMVNRVVPRESLLDEAMSIAAKLAERPRFALALTKQAFNLIDDLQGKRTGMDGVFAMHHLAHAHNQLVHGTASLPIAGQKARSNSQRAPKGMSATSIE